MTHIDLYPTSSSSETVATPQTFEEVYEAYYDQILAQARRFNAADPEMATQETFMRAYINFDRYEDQGKTHMAWLSTILRNLVIDEKRRDAKIRQVPSSDSYRYESTPDRTTERTIHDFEFDRAITQHLVDVVGDRRARMLQLAADGYDYDEISEQVGVPVGTVRSNLSRARDALKGNSELRIQLGGSRQK